VVTTFHGHDINVLPGGPGARGYDRLFEEGDAFTANSRFLADRAVALGCPDDRLSIIRMGVELPPAPAVRAPSDGPMRVLTVARLVPEKGVSTAIEAVAAAVNAGAHLRYRVIGGGPLEAELRGQITAAGLEDVVTLAGPASEAEVQAAYRESDLFVLPSIRAADGSEEAQGLVLQEAQAMGLPVLTSSIGGIPEGIDDGASGYLVPPGDAAALSARLLELAGDPARRRRFGEHGRRLVEERFDIERLNDQLVDLYADVIAQRR
jgi:colanic acid/amylovoran biosynthesis glycosyltransferase